ncbi:ribonuclease T2 [Nereida sp. MMG025]|uniref:ribonuclease T2 n=1 Tax=Nereida sp. MMG025 TaxID=2909981 RepID=UPI001F44F4E9|nr:ribonuclease T2 [Nereida sp. MMG025]MCF6444310.1 ribonuclease T2 [Nereida sp. MMG025]
MRWLFALILSAQMAHADGERAGAFDYYVLALSWSPTWCALEGDARKSPQCDDDADFGWVLHGLWPQYWEGWPAYCRTSLRPATRSQTRAMADIMGTSGSAWHQWKKHGTCAGVPAADYFDLARNAYESITRPQVFRKLPRTVAVPAQVIEEAFLKANPTLTRDQITITCKRNRIQEARICLSRDDLTPVTCGRDVIRDCSLDDALMDPIR